MNNSYRFFENRECKYYPCHHGIDEINCLFCYCPLYHIKDCPGEPKFVDKRDRVIKVCTNCTFPHRADNYDAVISCIKRNGE